MVSLPVVLTPGEAGYFMAEIPVIPGCYSQGKTKEEALANIKEAAELCMESMEEEGWTIPDKYFMDHIEVAVA
ncbi:MAG: type II toxin-antitoxin system HicB family antitoxin [Chloroflexi bacterium]|nr:type II toxin-antitoxin system HicB family antitoxin [Chloroflexota bacterium]